MGAFLSRLFEALFETHPLHGMFVHFPIALSAVALLFVGLALWQRNEVMEQAAFYCVILVMLSTVVAGFTGYRDVIVRFDGEAALVDVKGYMAITLFFLTAGLSFVRFRKPDVLWDPSSMVLYVSGFVGAFLMAGTLGFLGGVILYGW